MPKICLHTQNLVPYSDCPYLYYAYDTSLVATNCTAGRGPSLFVVPVLHISLQAVLKTRHSLYERTKLTFHLKRTRSSVLNRRFLAVRHRTPLTRPTRCGKKRRLASWARRLP